MLLDRCFAAGGFLYLWIFASWSKFCVLYNCCLFVCCFYWIYFHLNIYLVVFYIYQSTPHVAATGWDICICWFWIFVSCPNFLCFSTILSLCLMFIKYIFLFYLILLYPCDSYRPVCRGRSQVGRAASRPRRSATGSVPTRPRLGAAARCLTDRRGSVAAAAATRVAAGWTAEAFLLSGNVKCISATYILAVNLLHYQFFCVEQHS